MVLQHGQGGGLFYLLLNKGDCARNPGSMKKEDRTVMRVRFSKVLCLMLVTVFCFSLFSVDAKADSYPSVFFFSDEEFENLIVKDSVQIGTVYTIRMKWYAAFNNEGYIIRIKDPSGKAIAGSEATWANNTSIKRISVEWDTSGYKPGRYTIEVTKQFYSYYRWNEAPTTAVMWLILEEPTSTPTTKPTSTPTTKPTSTPTTKPTSTPTAKPTSTPTAKPTSSPTSTITNGECGPNAYWRVQNGTLTISGTGKMYDYSVAEAPWNSQRKNIKNVIIENGITIIGENCFYRLENVSSIQLPSSLTKIKEWAFYYCGVNELIIPEGCETIEDFAFADSGIKELTLPKSLKSMDSATFDSMGKLSIVYYNGTEEEWNNLLNMLDSYDRKTIVKDLEDVELVFLNKSPIVTPKPTATPTATPTPTPKPTAAPTPTLKPTVTPTTKPSSKRELIEAFVTRCYKVILYRAPDVGGLKNWADALESGSQAASNIIDGFVNSQEFLNKHLSNGDAVEILYKAMLDRASDAGGKAYWVDILSQGNPFGAVINGFCGSQEFMKLCREYGIKPGSVDVVPAGKRAKIEAFVKRCYQIILSRDPDAGGLNNWANALESGAQAASNIIDGFVNSQEFLNKHLSNGDAVEILYRAMLGRESDAAGKANWVNVLNAGQPFAAVINGFCGSQEFTALCNDYGIKPGSVVVNSRVLLTGTDATEPEEVDAVETERIDVPEETNNITTEESEPSTIDTAEVTVPEETVPIEPESVEATEEIEAAETKGIEETVTEEEDQIEPDTADTTEENIPEGTEENAPETIVEETVEPEETNNIETEVPAEINVIEVPEDEVIEDESVVINLDETETDGTVNDNITEPADENVIPEEAEEPEAASEAVSEAVSETAIEPENDSKVREFVSHCYAAVLGREADEAGLNDYTQQIATGAKSAKQIAHSFVFSNEFQGKHLSNEDIVRVLYRLYLYREADAEGLAGWVEQLDAGTSLSDVVNGFAQSAEYKAVINGMK